ncbi:hypothetical protein O3P69_006683 [Scylla paramamosain]|uniref:Hexosyltransferase n=1 Tax=Scylla paramamosain TaxID=85552 RepID=A0AAW0U2G7_SCYPA
MQVLSSTFIPVEPDTVPVGQSPDIPKRFLIEEADYCKRRPKLQIIAYIHSSILRVKQRNETRSSWANASAYNMGPMNVSIGVVFMVGRAKNELERLIIQEESKKYHDIVQGDYGDHYRLLTYKGLAGLYWINQHCAHVPWTLHSDDDTHIDIFLYHQALRQLDEESKQKFICSHMYGPALRYGRYKVRYEEYPARDYPLYCSGGVWFLQTRFIPRLLEARKTVPYLWVDDAYITGLLARRAGIGHLPFQRYYGGPHVHPEKLGKEVACQRLAAAATSPSPRSLSTQETARRLGWSASLPDVHSLIPEYLPASSGDTGTFVTGNGCSSAFTTSVYRERYEAEPRGHRRRPSHALVEVVIESRKVGQTLIGHTKTGGIYPCTLPRLLGAGGALHCR